MNYWITEEQLSELAEMANYNEPDSDRRDQLLVAEIRTQILDQDSGEILWRLTHERD